MIVRTPDVFDLKRNKSFQFMKTESYILYIGSIWITFNPIKGGNFIQKEKLVSFPFFVMMMMCIISDDNVMSFWESEMILSDFH